MCKRNDPSRRSLVKGLGALTLTNFTPFLSFAQDAVDNSVEDGLSICGELHPSSDEIQKVKDIISEENSTYEKLVGQEAAALRVHPDWGRWSPARIKQNRPLRVAFMQKDHPENNIVIEAARKWEKHMRLKFDFVGIYKNINSPGNLDILITQDAVGSNSYMGVACRHYALAGYPTMNIEKFPKGATKTQKLGVALHELGHALGLIHEHQNPSAKLNIDEAAVRSYYKNKYKWNESQIKENILNQYSTNGVHAIDLRTDFDQKSIMMYALPGSVFPSGHPGFKRNYVLSQGDRQIIWLIYG